MSDAHPFFSVMIPTWNPNPVFLREALESVLAQDWGVANMQITVCDDASTQVDVRALLESWGLLARVEFVAGEQNLGIGGAWNRCIEHARGEWIHILHQDDRVLDGFYARAFGSIKKEPSVKNIFCRTRFLKENGETKLSPEVQSESGFLTCSTEYFVTDIIFQCPSVIVNRILYEDLGLFRTDLKYSLDREMWVRIGVKFRFYYINEVLSEYRISENSTTNNLSKNGEQFIDSFKGVRLFTSYLDNRKSILNCYKKIAQRISWKLIDEVLDSKSQISFSVRIKLIMYLFVYARYRNTLLYAIKRVYS